MAEKQEAEAGTHLYPDDIVAHRHANHLLNTNDNDVSLGVSSAEDDDDLFGSTSPRRQRSKPKSYNNKKGGALGGNGDFAYSFRPGDINGNDGQNKVEEEDVMIMGGEASFSNFAIKDPRFHDKEDDKSSSPAANKNKNGISAPKDVSVKSLEHLLRLLILKKEGGNNNNNATTTTPTSDDSTIAADHQVGVPIKHLSLNGSNGACLLYTSDAADEEDSVDLGGRRIIKKKKKYE
eukprot:TRINITY_DN21358_c0_g2_i1.p1 TRINITY_DN21358_c0_g2~~TRINITY_DN21358_c0_g2_i1.p1  ORF type:complete len:235 (-),score=88.11 TRINITY_DN21358_c0_g2_i1:75-779(-)